MTNFLSIPYSKTTSSLRGRIGGNKPVLIVGKVQIRAILLDHHGWSALPWLDHSRTIELTSDGGTTTPEQVHRKRLESGGIRLGDCSSPGNQV